MEGTGFAINTDTREKTDVELDIAEEVTNVGLHKLMEADLLRKLLVKFKERIKKPCLWVILDN